MKKRKPMTSAFAGLLRAVDARKGDATALAELYKAYDAARKAFRYAPSPQLHLALSRASGAYWSAFKATPEYPKED